MKFKHGERRQPIVYEKELVKYWKDRRIFQKSIESRPIDSQYVFYDGPPFITGVPHHGTLLSSVVKDAVPRYQTMKGQRVERVWGWDCHGLPAEVYTEQKLGIKDKRDIGTKISLEDYIIACRDNMIQTGDLWEATIDRIGRWVDFKGAYKTMDKDYMESVWWAFKTLYDKGKIYEGEKVLLYCTRDETPLSKAEVSMDNESYRDVTDPSVYVKFKIDKNEYHQKIEEDIVAMYDTGDVESKAEADRLQKEYSDGIKQSKGLDGDIYLLAWTTTPWTLPANTALAVWDKLKYSEVLVEGQRLIIADDLIEKVLVDDKHKPIVFEVVVPGIHGSNLVGLEYEPLFQNRGPNAHKVWGAPYVDDTVGTGILHLAPAYGEEDYQLAKEKKLPIIVDTDERGMYTEGDWAGEVVWDVNKDIAKTLYERGVVWKIEYITHPYPHCHRCGTKLMYRAHPSWFMDIDGQRQDMLAQNGPINWFPEHMKQGRFAKTVQSAPDWNISRDRFWATAMPVWKGVDKAGNELVKVVGSYAELKQLSGVELEDYHRPWVDEVTFTIDGVEYQRVDKVMDSWFESGSMPFAQYHYPFENADKFENRFPGDFISEYVAQVRAWFYYLHALSIGIFGTHSFKNAVVTGTIAGNDGRKMSKSYGNYTDPNELMDTYGADALRYHFLSSPVLNGEDLALQDKDVADISRKLAMVWNMYDFFTLYAEVDGWTWSGQLDDPGSAAQNHLDIWILSRLHQVISQVDSHMQNYDLPSALKPILPFIDDISNWYVRRSRRRFWKSQNDDDKLLAYQTLHYVLVQLAHILAPFTPFLADELFIKLTGQQSVHLRDWPRTGHVNQMVLDNMDTARRIITIGLGQRAAAGVKVRQPLGQVKVVLKTILAPEYAAIIKDELNIKELEQTEGTDETVTLDTKITTKLQREGQAREIVRNVQQLRKSAGLSVDDRINLKIKAPWFKTAQAEYKDLILNETLAVKLDTSGPDLAHKTSFKVGSRPVEISLGRV